MAGSVVEASPTRNLPVRLLRWLGLDAAKQSTLFRLRARLKYRQLTGESGAIVGAFIAVLVIGPFVLVAAVGTTLGYWRLDPPWNSELLGGTLVILWLIWLIMPILAFSTNEALDISRLLVYPLRVRDLFVATLLGTVFDFPTYLLLPLFIAVFLGWGASLALPVVVVGLLLAYAHMVIGSQLVLLAAGGVLRSRRFRDLSIVLISFLGFSCYFINQIFRWLLSWVDVDQLSTMRPLLVIQWLPTGAVARAIERATAQAWLEAIAWLLYSLLLLLLVAWAWRHLMMALITGHRILSAPVQEKADKQRKRTRLNIGGVTVPQAKVGRGAWLSRFFSSIPFDIRYLFANELRAIWRLPQRRIGLLQALLIPIMLAIMASFNEGDLFTRSLDYVTNASIAPWLTLGLPGYSIFSIWIVSVNMVGWESRGLPSLLVTPVERWRIFFGKGLGLILIMSIPLAILGIVGATLLNSWLVASSILGAIGVGITVIGVSTIVSVLFPYPVNPDSINNQMSFSKGGCMTAFANAFVVPMLVSIACLPIFGLLAATAWWVSRGGSGWLTLVSMFFALVYGATAFWFGCRFAGNLLLQREPEVLLATRLADDDS